MVAEATAARAEDTVPVDMAEDTAVAGVMVAGIKPGLHTVDTQE